VKIGLLGLGTVGTGVYEIVSSKGDSIKQLLGDDLEIAKILVKNINKERSIDVNCRKITTDPYEILNCEDIDVIVEVIGGTTDAYSFIKYALNKGKHVVTANKAVVAKHMREFMELSYKNNTAFLYEASVCGGTPIIKPLKETSKINDILEIKGILNGTSNFILTKMKEGKLDFVQALELAQNLGYAEADPTDDIEGYDVRRKLTILSSIAFKVVVKEEDIFCRGIKSIKYSDFETFNSLNLMVKLIGRAFVKDKEYFATVEPVLLQDNSMLAMAKDAYNMVSVSGSIVGELMFYGQGAGKDPTASAVVSDILDILTESYQKDYFSQDDFKLSCNNTVKSKYYIRITPKQSLESEILSLVTKQGIIVRLVETGSDIVLISEKITQKYVAKVIESIEMYSEDFFYARIENNLSS
jgi:homoserine dehydrogenase